MNIVITKPHKNDEQAIKKLFTIVITQNFKDYGLYDKYRGDILYEVGKQISILKEYFESNGKNVYFLIAKVNTKIIGTIAYGKPSTDIEKYYFEKSESIPEIKSLYVIPEYQNKGVGTILLEKIMNELRKNGIKEFCLDSGYPKAQQFWTKKLGKPIIRIHNRWGAGNDYLIWHFTL